MEDKLKEKDRNLKQIKENHQNQIEIIQTNGKSIEEQMNKLQIRLQVFFHSQQRSKNHFIHLGKCKK